MAGNHPLSLRLVRAVAALALALGSHVQAQPLINDSTIDLTFGSGGGTIIGPPGTFDAAASVIRTPSNYWLLGISGGNLGIAQLTSAGQPTAFGTAGFLSTGLAGTPYGSAYTDSQGRIVARVFNSGGSDYVARYLPSGVLDTSFSGDGLWFPDGNQRIYDVALAPNDRVWVSMQELSGFVNAQLIRLLFGGTVDGSFTPLDDQTLPGYVPYSYARLHRDADGSIWWAPLGLSGGTSYNLVVRLTAAGALDSTYSGNGVAELPNNCPGSLPFGLFYSSLTVLPGGTAVVRHNRPPNEGVAAIVALPNGAPGPLRCDGPDDTLSKVNEIAARDSTRFFGASRYCNVSGACGVALRRFVVQGNGAIVDDPTFDVAATAQILGTTDGSTPDGEGVDVIVDAGKPVIAGGARRSTTNFDFVAIRYGGANFIFADGFE